MRHGMAQRNISLRQILPPLSPLTQISSVQQGTKAQRQMSWHILVECKAAQDHLQIMIHDILGCDEV